MTADYSLESLEAELQSLIRVRNRLAVADDRQLPKILTNLLPRLLAKFDRINSCHSGSAKERSLFDQINLQCTGIFSHALDRIRLARTGEFCDSVLGGIAHFKSAAAVTVAITLVRTGLPFRASDPGPIKGFDFSPVVTLVHEAHEALAASHHATSEQGTRSSAPSTFQLMYRMSGWVLGDCIALTADLPLTSDSAVVDDKTRNGCDAHSRLSGASESFNLTLDGLFHFVLDLLLYGPTSPSLTVHDVRNNADLTVPDNATGISSEGLVRMQSWNTLSSLNQLRQLKLVALKYALVPLSRQTSHGGSATASGEDDAFGLADVRKRALAVLFDDPRFPHGSVTRLYWNHLRGRSIGVQSYGCTTQLAIVLLFLALGEEEARRALNQMHSHIWEPLVGKESAVRHPGLLRGPLPLHVSARAIKFIQDGFQLPSEKLLDAEVVQQLEVVVALVVELQNSSHNGLFWGMQLMYKLYSELGSFHSKERGRDGEGFRRRFYRQCLEVSKRVLALLPDHVEIRRPLRRSNRDPHQANQMHIDERLAVDGDQGHLDAIISNHRQHQKNRMLSGSDALKSRRCAFEMISEIVLDPPMRDERVIRDLCVAVFSWVPCEEDESNDTSKTKALSSLFRAIRGAALDVAPMSRDEVIYTMIPHLLAAACHDSPNARLVAIEWSSKLVAGIEPAVAKLICAHLACDTHDLVSKKAQLFSVSPPCNSLGHPIASTENETRSLDTRLPECRAEMANQLVSWLEQIQREFGLDLDVSLAVLTDQNFSVQASIETLRNDFAGTLLTSGLMARTGANGGLHSRESEPARYIECGICYEETNLSETFALPCRDAFCCSCWGAYVSDQLGKKSTAGRLTCPNHRCQERVLLSDVTKLNQALVATWHDALLTMLIDKCDSYSSCPGPDCPMVACRFVHPHQSDAVQCSLCSTTYCFQCRQEPHAPAECSELDEWNRIYSSSKFWIQTNTKPCPTCKVPIEKNQGCNHMQCTLCGADFCWLCRSSLRNHMEVHSCNAYHPLESADNDDERRAIFFTERFGSHQDAELYCRKRLNHYETDSKSVADRYWYLSGDDLNDICGALEDVADARKVLQYSYVSAWSRSLQGDPHLARFTQLQATLENLTERLSTLTLATSLESVYHDQRLPGHFRIMSFLQQAIHLFVNRMRGAEYRPASNS